MGSFKPISKGAIERALAKAERYRLLNEPREAESICHDILSAEPGHQRGLVTLLLALTDQFDKSHGIELNRVLQLLPQIQSSYERTYYEGVIYERWGKAQLGRGTPSYIVDEWLRKAMSCFESAEADRPPNDDDAILRWNTCARMIESMAPQSAREGPPRGAEPLGCFDEEGPLL